MKVLIISDTHGYNGNFYKVLKLHKPDMLIHCGDLEGTEDEIRERAGCPVKMVCGNNDFFSDLPAEEEFEIAGFRCFLTHGHRYRVSVGPERILDEARSRGANVVIYGHTHKPEVTLEGGIYAVNPGSLSYPRQEGRKPSYIIMETDRFGDLHFTIAYLED